MENTLDTIVGAQVKVGKLGDTEGMLIKERHLACRREGATGRVAGWVPGHGGDVWWVKHDGSDEIGAYCWSELELL